MNTIGQFLTGGAVLGFVTAVIQYLLTRPKVRQEAAKTATEAAGLAQQQLRDIIADLNRRIDQQDTRITRLDAENDRLERHNDALEASERAVRQNAYQMRLALRDLSAWCTRYYDKADPPLGVEAPPVIDESKWPLLEERPPTPTTGDLQ